MSTDELPDDDDDPTEPGSSEASFGTWALFAINVGVFLSMLTGGASLMLVEAPLLVAWGGASAVDIWAGEVWRLATTMFVHGAIWHLGLNMWVFLQLGRELERILGTSRFLLLYLASGLFGSALSLLVHPHLSVGASGAIFGVVGGLFAFALKNRGQKMSRMLVGALTPFVLVTLIVGFLVPFIDNSAHVGGLLAGFLIGYGLIPRSLTLAPSAAGPQKQGPQEQGANDLEPVEPAAWAALIVVAAGFLILLPMALKPAFNPNYEVAQGWAALKTGRTEKAQVHADAAAQLSASDPGVLILFARLAMGTDDEGAKALFSQAVVALDEPDAAALMTIAASGMVGGRPSSNIAWAFDPRTTRGLCDALLEREKGKPSPAVANNCAWTMIKSHDPLVRDLKRGRELSTRAVRLELSRVLANDDRETDSIAAYLHTLAESHAQAGDPEEARIILERVLSMGYSEDKVYRDDLQRFADLTRKAKRGNTRAANKPEEQAPTPTPAQSQDAGVPAADLPAAERDHSLKGASPVLDAGVPLRVDNARTADESAMMDGGSLSSSSVAPRVTLPASPR